MPLPTPDLDDRRFQDLVDDAKRLIQQRCPEWTDHNVSDPGVTLIEAFAQMVDQLIYRLNRVPDRHYVKFLDLLGVQMFPPTAATGEVTFRLAAKQPADVVVRAETEVATARTDIEEPVVFRTTKELRIVSCELRCVATQRVAQEPSDQTNTLQDGRLPCFSEVPRPGDALLIGLSNAVPSCLVVLRFDCPVRGHGIDPRNPPLIWEALTGTGWSPCEVEDDEAGGFNRSGDVTLRVPASHRASPIVGQPAWLRCRVVSAVDGQPPYKATPEIASIRAFTIGGTVGIVHAQIIHDEVLGISDGTPGQRFALQRRPVLREDRPAVLQVGDETVGWTDWLPVGDFASSAADDRHYRLDQVAGEVQFGPAVRQPKGGLRQYGGIPPKGSTLRMAAYRIGGGSGGNIASGQVRVLKTSVPYVALVENRDAITGGVEGESVENAKLRGSLGLRASGRAVTAEDFEELARTAAPDAARVRCVPASETGGALAVRVLVVPRVTADSQGELPEEILREPPNQLMPRIKGYLEERRLVGTRVLVVPPEYHGITVVARLGARDPDQGADVRRAATRALYRYLSPLTGGPERTGWPFGRAVQAFEVAAMLVGVPGVASVDEVPALPRRSGQRAAGRSGTATRHRQECARPVLQTPGSGDMRGTVTGLASPHPLGETLPAIYADDSFTQRLCQALDEVLAPVLSTLDCLPAYLDPATAPADIVEWLGSWVGVAIPPAMPDVRRRQLVAAAARLYVLRGTLPAIRTIVELSCGQTPEIRESGGTSWSLDPNAPLPGQPEPELVIRLRVGPDVDQARLAALIDAFVPAHVQWQLELVPDSAG